MFTPSRKKSGFTLLEVIVVIVLLGILGSAAGLLIVKPIQAYTDIERRQRLVDQGERALGQIARDIRRALPNSIRALNTGTGFATEMINTVDGARYRDEIGGDFVDDDDVLDFKVADAHFNLLGHLNTVEIVATDPPVDLDDVRIVIYSITPDVIYQHAANDTSPGIITPSTTTLTLTLNSPILPDTDDAEYHIEMDPAFEFSQQSPGQRLFLVNGSISYICDLGTGEIFRYSNYNYQVNQETVRALMTAPTGINATESLLVSNVTNCLIDYNPGASQRSGLVTLEMTIQDSGEAISLMHQVHVVNVP
ncbi:MAG: MSHA biogenesis protein MshO [Gammaproteobacteria bacterium]|jgi:MSHA biogenesis protein MshO